MTTATVKLKLGLSQKFSLVPADALCLIVLDITPYDWGNGPRRVQKEEAICVDRADQVKNYNNVTNVTLYNLGSLVRI